MHIIDVIPTIKIPKSDIQLLTYFSQAPLAQGVLVMVPLGHRKIPAIVVGSLPAHEQKIAIKKSGFAIKGISKVLSEEPILSPAQIALMKWCAEYYCAPLPLFAKIFVPPYFAKRKTPVRLSRAEPVKQEGETRGEKPMLIAKNDRCDDYARAINAARASGKQTLLLVPELALARFWQDALRTHDPVLVTSELTDKKFFDAWDAARTGNASLVIGTRAALFANFKDLGLIIIDDEHNPHFKSWDMAPYYHAKTVALALAGNIGARCILGSAAPSVESFWRVREGAYELSLRFEAPKISPAVIDMRNEMRDKNFTTISYLLKSALETALEKKQRTILFIARRGSESFIFCPDCSHIERCPHCATHLVHHTAPRRALICHQCGYETQPPSACSQCKNPHVRAFGAGTQKVAHDIAQEFPDARIAILDTDTAPTFASQQKIIGDFRDGTYDIIIGTQTLLAKPDMPNAACVAVVSFDNLLYLPDYKMPERLYHIVRSLQAYCAPDGRFFLQTLTPDNETITSVAAQRYEAFYEREIAARKALRYPPFSRIVKITVRADSRANAEREAARVADAIRALCAAKNIPADILGPAPAYIAKVRQLFIEQIIVKFGNIDHNALHAIVTQAAGRAIIDVDPEHIL